MKHTLTVALSLVVLLTGCHTAHTQGGPQVIAVPDDEMTREPSLGPATLGTPTPPPEAGPDATPLPALPTATPAPITTPTPVASAALPKGTAPVRYSYNSCNVDGPYIAITFDDGPSAKLTPQLLDMLKERGIKATFFMVGQNVAEYPAIVKRMVDEGHEVANHSWSHPALTKLSADAFRKQIKDTNDAIEKASGVRPTVMRPPYGATNANLDKILNTQFGLKVIIWDVDPLDWKFRNAERVASQIINGTKPGSIILAHDIHATTVAAMPKVFDTLLAKGYKFVTVSELIAMDQPLPPAPPKPAAEKPKPLPKPVGS